MSTSNFTPSLFGGDFVVLCFPEKWSQWKSLFSVFIVILFAVALFANLSLLLVVWVERSLHTPMYYFICVLSFIDLSLCSTVTPTIISILLFDLQKIHASTCFLQIYLNSSLISLQTGVFMVMAFDRYIAICKPLQYPSIISKLYVPKALSVMFVRSCIITIPLAALPAQLTYCAGNVVKDCYCNCLNVAKLACDSNPIIEIYPINGTIMTAGSEISFITFSYSMILRAVLRLRSKEASMKALSTCCSHFIVISYFYCCEIILTITNVYRESMASELHTLLELLFWFAPPVVNPLVYALRTKAFKNRAKGILKMQKIKS